MRRATALAATLAVAVLLGPAPGVATAEQTLSVVGQGVARPTPDVATVTVSIRRVRAGAESARSSVNSRANRIIDAARALDVPRSDIQTNQIELSRAVLRPLRKGGKRRIRYTASTELEVRFADTDVVGRFLNAATALGASSFEGPEFTFSSPNAGRAEAEQNALRDARKRADAAAALLGLRVIGVRSLDLNPESLIAEPTPTASEQAAGSTGSPAPKKSPAPTQVEAGAEDVTATVNVVFLIGP